MMVSTVIIGLASVLSARAAQASPWTQQYEFETFADGPSSVIALAQTNDGYLWMATPAGPVRFDGVRFSRLGQLPSAPAYSLLATRDGSLWLGQGGTAKLWGQPHESRPGLLRLRRGQMQQLTTRDGLPDDRIWALAEDRGVGIWMGTERGAVHWQDGVGATRVFSKRDGLPDEAVTCLHVDSKGRVWIGTPAGLALLLDNKLSNTAVSGPVRAIAEDGRGVIWVGTSRGLWSFDGERWSERRRDDGFPYLNLAALAGDANGGLWVAALGALYKLDGPSTRAFRDEDQLPDGQIQAMLLDRERRLWLATRAAGPVQVKWRRFWNFGRKEGLAQNRGGAALAGDDGSVWVSTQEGLCRWRDGAITTYKRPDLHLRTDGVRNLSLGRQGEVWMSAGRDGVIRHRSDVFERFPLDAATKNDSVDLILGDRAGRVWVTWRSGRVTFWPDGALGRPGQQLADGLCSGRYVGGSPDNDGGVWLASQGGLTHVSPGQIRCYTSRDGLPRDTVHTVFRDRAGTLWLGLDGWDGIVRVRNGMFRAYQPGFPAPLGIVEDERAQQLWFGTRQGVVSVAERAFDDHDAGRAPTIPWLGLGRADGMASEQCVGDAMPTATNAGGVLWFSTLLGVTAINPEVSSNLGVVAAQVEEVLADGVSYGRRDEVRVPPGRGYLEFRYSAPTFVLARHLVFAYRLIGFDKAWFLADGPRVARYANLPPGDYAFEVRVAAIGTFATTGPTAIVRAHLAPFFHQTRTFLFLLAMAGVLVVGLVHVWRVRQVRARHAAILQERTRIARDLHDNLGQGFTALGYHLDALNQTLADSIARETVSSGRKLLDHCQDETRRLIWDLRKGDAGDVEIVSAIRETIDALGVQGSPRLRFQLVGTPRRTSGELEHELPLVAKEAITNALKHADAKEIVVRLEFADDAVVLSVKDDGRGFDPAAPETDAMAGRFGTIGMHERGRRLRGTLSISSEAGHGSEVTLRVPTIVKQESEST